MKIKEMYFEISMEEWQEFVEVSGIDDVSQMRAVLREALRNWIKYQRGENEEAKRVLAKIDEALSQARGGRCKNLHHIYAKEDKELACIEVNGPLITEAALDELKHVAHFNNCGNATIGTAWRNEFIDYCHRLSDAGKEAVDGEYRKVSWNDAAIIYSFVNDRMVVLRVFENERYLSGLIPPLGLELRDRIYKKSSRH